MEFEAETLETLAYYLGYSQNFYNFKRLLETREINTVIYNKVLELLDKLAELETKSYSNIGAQTIKKIEDIEFENSMSTAENYKIHAADMLKLLSKILDIPLLYNMYSDIGIGVSAIQCR